MQASFDAHALLQAHALEGLASWADEWTIEFQGPAFASSFLLSASVLFQIQAHAATVEVEAGFEVLLDREPSLLVNGMIDAVFEEAVAAIGSLWGGRERFASFARGLIDRLTDRVGPILESVTEASLYFQVSVEGADSAGAGQRFSLVADGTALRELFRWASENVAVFVERMFDPLAPGDFASLPRDLLAHVFLRVAEFGVLEPPEILRMTGLLDGELALCVFAEANFAAMERIQGGEGDGAILRFGAFGRVYGGLARVGFVRYGWITDASLLTATIHLD